MLPCQKHLFDLPDNISYINNAYMGPMLKKSEEIAHNEVRKKLRPWLYTKPDFFEPVEQLKSNFAKLIGCDDPQRIALIPSASYGLANAAKNVRCEAGKNILVVGEQFPSNYYTWEAVAKEKGATIKVISDPMVSDNRSHIWNKYILESIDNQTAVVAMPVVHWADGTLFDLKAIRAKTNEVGAAFVIDGTQSIGALPFDFQEIQPDALICASYKWLFGTYGLGCAYYGPMFDNGQPIEDNWINRKDSDQFENLVNYQPEYQPKAARYSVGENSNFVYVPMLNASIEQILEWGVDNIQGYCKSLVSGYISEFQNLGCSVGSTDAMAYHLFGIRMPEGIDIMKLKAQLEQEKVYISIRGNAIRVSPNVYNEGRDMERLLTCLKNAIPSQYHML